jgi:hypothetical protein
MASNSETGHAKNVANFKPLIASCIGYGIRYNPAKANLQLPAIENLHKEAEAVIKSVYTGATIFNKATNERMDAFSDVKQFSTQLINALATSGASAATIADAKGFNRKIQGKRAETKPVEIKPEDGQTNAQIDKTISVSQQSYDAQVEHLSKMHELLLAEENYKPNEAELTTAGVAQKLELLKAANQKVATAYTQYSNSRIARDTTLYDALNGLVAVAIDIKKYVLSVFKANSPQYKQISGIKFRNIKA